MRNFSSRKGKTLGSVAVVASLALAAPVMATGTAHAAVKVTVKGTVSCARFGDSTPDTVTVTPKKGIADSDELPGDNETESYSVLLTGIPKNGTQATAKVVCLDSDNEQHTYAKTFQVAKPAAGGAEVKNFG